MIDLVIGDSLLDRIFARAARSWVPWRSRLGGPRTFFRLSELYSGTFSVQY